MPLCYSCLRPLKGHSPVVPVCIDCWPKLSEGDRARLMSDNETRLTLRAILAQLQGNSETEQLERAADKIELHAKRQAEEIAAVRQEVLSFLEWVRERMETGDDEPWRG